MANLTTHSPDKEVYYIYGKHATKDMFLNDNELPILKYEIEKSKCKIQVCVDNETNQFYYILYLNQDDAMELGLIGGEFQILK